MSRPSLIVADDHGLFIEGLRRILEPEYEIVATLGDGRALVRAVEQRRPDLILVDITLPLLNGIDAVRQIRKNDKRTPIVMLTMHSEAAYAAEAFDAGAQGYVLKHAVTGELLEALRQVLAGKRYVSPRLAEHVENLLAEAASSRRRSVAAPLSERRREVLQLIAEGYSAKQIGDILHISPRTVDFHKKELKKDLGVGSTPELVQQAVRLGIIHPGD